MGICGIFSCMEARLCGESGFRVGETSELRGSGELSLIMAGVPLVEEDDAVLFCFGVLVLGFFVGGSLGTLSDVYFFISFSYLSLSFSYIS